MELFQQLHNDLIKRFRMMPRARRLALVLLATLVIVSLVCLWRPQANETHVQLLPQLVIPTSRLADYELAFSEAGLDGYTIDQQQITVPKSQKSSYMAALKNSELLPLQSGQFMKSALNKSSPFENRKQREDRIKNAHERELAENISRMKGIEEATVNYDAEESSGIRQRTVFTASIAVRASSNEKLDPQQAQIIREYLSGCIAGLETNKVYIVDLNHAPSLAPSAIPSRIPTGLLAITPPATPFATEKSANSQGVSSWILALLGCAVVAACLVLWRQQQPITTDSFGSDPTDYPKVASDPNPQSSDVSQVDLASEVASTPVDDTFTEESSKKSGRPLVVPGETFFRHLIPHQQTAGIELSELTSTHPAYASATAEKQTEGIQDPPPFHFVSEVNPNDLYQLLKNESAQIIAIVFSHLESEQAAEVLSSLPTPLQIEVLSRLSDLEDLSEEVLQEIEQSLEKRIADQLLRNSKRNAGIRVISDLLDLTNHDVQASILQGLKGQDTKLAEQLLAERPKLRRQKQSKHTAQDRDFSKTPTSVDDLIYLDGKTLCKVLSAVDKRDAILALSSLDEEIVQRVTKNMKPEEADRLQKALAEIGPTHSREISASCKSVARMVHRLRESGGICLRSSSSSGAAA